MLLYKLDKGKLVVTGFYQDLYRREESQTEEENDDFYEHCPRLSRESSQALDGELTQAELLCT